MSMFQAYSYGRLSGFLSQLICGQRSLHYHERPDSADEIARIYFSYC